MIGVGWGGCIHCTFLGSWRYSRHVTNHFHFGLKFGVPLDANKFSGLREFIDQSVSYVGKDRIKPGPATERCCGLPTYPTEHQRQSRCMPCKCLTLAMPTTKERLIGRAQGEKTVGDLIEMLLSGFSFVAKEATFDWSWLVIDPKEWPSQRLDGEVHRVEHLTVMTSM